MKIQDDRTVREQRTHTTIVVARDKFLSGWGDASGGDSFAGWACKDKDTRAVEAWVANRTDTEKVKVRYKDYRPQGKGHYHIYVVREGHAALEG